MAYDDDWETESSSSSDSALHDIDVSSLALIETPPLLPVPPDVSCHGDKLCDVCKGLKLTAKSFAVLPGDQEYGRPNQPDELNISLGKVEDVIKKTGCPLCRLVLVALGGDKVPLREDGEPVVVDLSWNTDGPSPDAAAPWSHIPEIRLLRPYARSMSGSFVQSVRLNLFPEITLLANDSPTSSVSYFVRPISRDKIDFGLVRRWIAICHTQHRKSCKRNPALKELRRSPPTSHHTSHPTEEVPNFRCIDVEQKCLVKPVSGDRYAALSYVWGRRKFFRTLMANVADLEQPGALAKEEHMYQLPPTIKDAIHVTRETGLKYLWVDCLCIVQDDNSDKKVQAIKLMDLVYAAADIVIVAAGSVDAYSGIPGINPGSRGTRQPIEEIPAEDNETGQNFRLAFKTRWQDSIDTVPYYTRAWTWVATLRSSVMLSQLTGCRFQETHFATRSLVFIDGKVTFNCQAVSDWQEHLFEAESEINGEQARSRGPFQDDDIGEFEGLIQDYSGRVLSYGTDVYSAFAGVARQLSLRMNTNLVHGIPARYFDWFLLWGPLDDQVRRLNAPSWSWAGWVGGCFPRVWDWYNRSIRRIDKAIQQRTWIIWYQRRGHDSTSCELVFKHDRGPQGASEKINFYGARVRRRFDTDCSQTEPTQRKLGIEDTRPPTYSEDVLSQDPGSGFLQFWTVSISLRLAEPTSTEDDVGPKHNRRRLGIFGRNGQELGTISVHSWWLEKNAIPQVREFILICEGRDKRAEHGKIDNEEGWRYMVMLLEWHGEYAERVALGSIGKEDLKEGLGDGIHWKEIVLG
ncbi:hypothetical protein DL765_008851 [Monosporascus sp. GIB2]|nr:hypothetical protein DL765_008851 [Monosporascus sp. GIB2]